MQANWLWAFSLKCLLFNKIHHSVIWADPYDANASSRFPVSFSRGNLVILVVFTRRRENTAVRQVLSKMLSITHLNKMLSITHLSREVSLLYPGPPVASTNWSEFASAPVKMGSFPRQSARSLIVLIYSLLFMCFIFNKNFLKVLCSDVGCVLVQDRVRCVPGSPWGNWAQQLSTARKQIPLGRMHFSKE